MPALPAGHAVAYAAMRHRSRAGSRRTFPCRIAASGATNGCGRAPALLMDRAAYISVIGNGLDDSGFPRRSAMTLKPVRLDDKYDLAQPRVFVTGYQALVRLG